MTRCIGLASVSVLLYLLLSPAVQAQTVTNVRARQLADRTVEVLYDLTGAAAEGAWVTVAFSADGGTTYPIVPVASTLSGSLGVGVASGTNRRIVWNAAASLPAGSHGTNYTAAVTATNPGAGGQEVTVTLAGGVPLTMVRIPAGTFQMGSPATERGRYTNEVLHQVTLTSDYYMGKYGVTQGQWQAVMGTAMSTACGSYGIGASYPVYCVSWNDIRGAGGFIERLNAYLSSTEQAGAGKFRLPTEAERERAARGETQSRFWFGDALECDDWDNSVGCASADPYFWWGGNSGWTSHPVGMKQVNPYGLFDMLGNVAEWCEDWYGDYISSPQVNPTGPSTGTYRVRRGNGYSGYFHYSRSSQRNGQKPEMAFSVTGFRLCRSL